MVASGLAREARITIWPPSSPVPAARAGTPWRSQTAPRPSETVCGTSPAARAAAPDLGLTGTGELLRLALRRDRVLVPASVLGLVLLSVGSAQATLALYPDDASTTAGLGGVLANPGVIALYGPLASPTADALAVFKTVMMGAFLTAVLALVVVRRHTRTEEDEGRLELVGAGVVGRTVGFFVGLGTAVVVVCFLPCFFSVFGCP